MTDFSLIYKATYSGVPVYEMNCKGIAVMRRRSDSYLNATQILKVAEFDKPQRTRILEREVQTGDHEKVQGGYGKYQGTWVPFTRGKSLAELYGVHSLLAPLLEFVKGDASPPLAPKHVTAASARPRKSREPRTRKKPKHFGDDLSDFEPSPSQNTPRLAEAQHEETPSSPYSKRPRTVKLHVNKPQSPVEKHDMIDTDEDERSDTERDVDELEIEPMDHEHQDKPYAQRLFQFFMSNKSAVPYILNRPPRDLDINIIIDDEGHTSLHWAAAMGRIKIVELLVEKGADIYRVNFKGQTALMRSVLFTNNFDFKTFDSLTDILRTTIFNIDKKDQTVFHHTAAMSDWKGKIYASRYYMECLISKFKNNQSELISILNVQDVNGDTALTIAAKIGNRRILKLLIDAGASIDIVNEEGMAPKDYLTDIERSMISRNSISSPPSIVSSPSETISSFRDESNTRALLKTRIETMFKNVSADPSFSPPISEVTDEFADSYERDLIQKERSLDRKKIELDLYTKRLDETLKALNSDDFNNAKTKIKAMTADVEQQGKVLESKYKRWVKYSQKQKLQLLEDHEAPSFLQHYTTLELEETARKLKQELIQLEDARNQNVNKLVTLRCSIPPRKYQDYKRLISTSCNVPYDDVDTMLSPLLSSFDIEDTL